MDSCDGELVSAVSAVRVLSKAGVVDVAMATSTSTLAAETVRVISVGLIPSSRAAILFRKAVRLKVSGVPAMTTLRRSNGNDDGGRRGRGRIAGVALGRGEGSGEGEGGGEGKDEGESEGEGKGDGN